MRRACEGHKIFNAVYFGVAQAAAHIRSEDTGDQGVLGLGAGADAECAECAEAETLQAASSVCII